MAEKYIFWAQSLDNTSPDHFMDQGVDLLAEEKQGRQKIVSLIYEVAKRGRRRYDASGVALTATRRDFVLEVPMVELDVVGRSAPVTVYGVMAVDFDREFEDALIQEIIGFSERIGRTVRPDVPDLIRSAFAALKKKENYQAIENRRAAGA
jgi:hypothetical protein